VKKIPDDGSSIVVRDGVYSGPNHPTTIRAEHSYHARLTNPGGKALFFYITGKANLTLRGFEITNGGGYSCSTRQEVLIQLENATDVTLTDNVIHDNAVAGNCNELLKVNSAGENLPRRPRR